MSKPKDISNQKFGRLTALRPNGKTKAGKMLWLCQCECGNLVTISGVSLRNGNTRSCGCVVKEKLQQRNTRHGKCGTRLYRIYRGMVQRCNDPKQKCFAQYGGKGIAICDEWREYSAFEKWAFANGYAPNLTIDRIDNNGDYCPQNCRWVDSFMQAHNKSNNRMITYNGKTQTISEWARELGVAAGTIRYRLKKGQPITKFYKNEKN